MRVQSQQHNDTYFNIIKNICQLQALPIYIKIVCNTNELFLFMWILMYFNI